MNIRASSVSALALFLGAILAIGFASIAALDRAAQAVGEVASLTTRDVGCPLTEDDLTRLVVDYSKTYDAPVPFPTLAWERDDGWLRDVQYARYNDGERTVYLNRARLDKLSAAGRCSVIFHEVVHHYQNATGHSMKSRTSREQEAYHLTAIFSSQVGLAARETGMEDTVNFKRMLRHVAAADDETDLDGYADGECHTMQGVTTLDEVTKNQPLVCTWTPPDATDAAQVIADPLDFRVLVDEYGLTCVVDEKDGSIRPCEASDLPVAPSLIWTR